MSTNLAYLSDAILPSQGADSIQVVKTCEALSNLGAKVTLVVPNVEANKQDIHDYYGIDDCFEIRRVPFSPFERYQFSILSGYVAAKLDPDVVYGRFIPSCFFASLFGVDNIVIESHSPAADSGRIIGAMFYALIKLKKLQSLVVITESLRKHYIEKYDINLDDIHVVPDAASDPQPVDPLLDTNGFSVGYVGHLYEGKGMSLFGELARHFPEFEFHVVGGSDEDIKHWQTKLEKLENVNFHGFVPPADVARYQASFDVLVAPYERTVYGSAKVTNLSNWMSPLKLFEYMAVEKPILASNLPVIREVLTDEINSLLCDPESIDEWTGALQRLRNDPNLRNSIATQGRKDFENEYTYKARAKKILDVLEPTISS